MKIIIILSVHLVNLLFFAIDGYAREANQESIVVWRIEAKSGVSENDIDSISGYLTAELERISDRKAVSQADIESIIRGEETRQLCGAEATSCIAEIGAALGVPEAISGDLGRVGKYWMLNLRRINVKDASVISRIGNRVEGNISDLIEAIPGAVEELFYSDHNSLKQIDWMSKFGQQFIGVSGSLFPVAQYELLSGGMGFDTDADFGGGIILFYDFYILNYFSVGAAFQYSHWQAEMDPNDFYLGLKVQKTTFKLHEINLSPSFKGGIPFGNRNEYEPYVRFMVGYSAFILKDGFKEIGITDNKHGWNVRIGPGFRYEFPFGLSVFTELGYYHASHDSNELNTDYTFTSSAFFLDFGIGYVFGTK